MALKPENFPYGLLPCGRPRVTNNNPFSENNKCRVCGIAGNEIGADLVQGRGGAWLCKRCKAKPHPQILKNIGHRQLKMARLLLAGCTGREVAKELGISPDRVSIIRNSPLFEAMYNKMEADFEREVLAGLAERAQNV